jgi:hypothetical protein
MSRTAPAIHRQSSCLQIVLAQFFALYESNGAIGKSLLGHPIFNYAKKEAIRWRRQHADRNDALASRPPPKVFEASRASSARLIGVVGWPDGIPSSAP